MCTINTGTGYSGDNVGTTYLRMHRTNRSLGVCSYQRCRRRKTCSSRSRCHGDRTSRMRRAGNGRLDPRAPAAASASAHPAAGNGRTVSEHIPPLLQHTCRVLVMGVGGHGCAGDVLCEEMAFIA